MTQLVSITSQGQLTVPKSILQSFGIKGPVKAIVRKKGKVFEVEPKKDFWSLKGSLAGKIKLTDRELREARDAFEKDWAQE